MNQVLRLSLAMLAIVLFTAGAIAQTSDRQKMSKEEKIQMKVERMKSELNLSEEQTDKITSILKNHFQAEEKTREEHRAQRAAVHEEIKAVLTPEQTKKLEAMHAERKDKMKERHGDRKHMKNKGEERRKNMEPIKRERSSENSSD